MIPFRYARLPDHEQEAIALRIVDLRLLRDARLEGEAPGRVGRDVIIDSLSAELADLERPFADPHIHVDGEVGFYDQDGADFDEASFLRRFPGRPAIAGDILLAQIEVRLAAPLLEALLGLSNHELRSATAWWGGFGPGDGRALDRRVTRVAGFYRAAHEALGAVLEELGGSDERSLGVDALEQMHELLGARAEQYDTERMGDRILPWEPTDDETKVGPLTVSADLLQSVAGTAAQLVDGVGRLLRGVLGPARRIGQDRDHREDEPPERPRAT